MRRRTTSRNKEKPDLRQEESSEEEKDEEEEESRKVMYEVIIPHGILIGEVWIEYGEVVRGIKEDNLSKKVLFFLINSILFSASFHLSLTEKLVK